MADLGSILNFDSGISRVVWDTAGPAAAVLPDRRQLAPSGDVATQQLDRLLQADNIDAVLARGMRPAVGSADILRPDRFEDALQSASTLVARSLGSLTGEDKQAIEGLAEVLEEHSELKATLDYYRDMLIAG